MRAIWRSRKMVAWRDEGTKEIKEDGACIDGVEGSWGIWCYG